MSQGKDTGVPAERDGEAVQSCINCYNNGALQLGIKWVNSTKLQVCFSSTLKTSPEQLVGEPTLFSI